MIAFDLQCANNHLFEGWFEDSRAYREQLENGFVSCPICNDTRVTRVPSTFAIRSTQINRRAATTEVPPEALKLAEITRRVSEFVEENFDDVGSDFSREALKIHYGVSKPRSIRGVSTKEEEKTLRAEGIDFLKIPVAVQKDTDV